MNLVYKKYNKNDLMLLGRLDHIADHYKFLVGLIDKNLVIDEDQKKHILDKYVSAEVLRQLIQSKILSDVGAEISSRTRYRINIENSMIIYTSD